MSKNVMLASVMSAICAAGCGGGTTADRDTGTGGRDTGTAPVDTGPVDVDTGPVDVDTGPVDVDTGTTDVDSGATGMGACTNAADGAILATDVTGTVGDCAMSNFGAQPGTGNCIHMMTGLSTECSNCFGDAAACAVMRCLAQCIGGDTPMCMTCRAMNCDPAFAACSGLAP